MHRSARKHGVTDVDIICAATGALASFLIDDSDPPRELRPGFDTAGRFLESVELLLDDGDELVVHAMKSRPRYLDFLPRPKDDS